MKKGIRFYAELPDCRGSKAASKRWAAFTRGNLATMADDGGMCNCVAVLAGNGISAAGMWDAIGATGGPSNSAVCGVTVSPDYLRSRCVRISADLAARLHPRLAAYLASDPAD